MFTHKKFDVEIARKVDRGELGWPEGGAAQDDTGLGGNRAYIDLRRMTWAEARSAADLEREMIARIESAPDPEAEYEAVEDELFESDQGLYGLDLGVAGAVIALSAAGCVPCASCNAGAFGGRHHESHPLVVFYAHAEAVDALMAAAEEAEIGLEGGEWLVAYADDIRKMMRFAVTLSARSGMFRAARKGRPARKREPESASEGPNPAQGNLEFGMGEPVRPDSPRSQQTRGGPRPG
jgi:hypothetical protein